MKDLFDDPKIKDMIKNIVKKTGNHALKSKINKIVYLKQIKEASKYLKKNAKILDLGCGCGLVSLILKMKRPDLNIVGVNYPHEQESWKEIKKKFDIDFRVGDGLNLEFKDNTFDAVLAFGVLEHVNDYRGRKTENGEDLFLKEVRRITKDKGIFFICNLPNYYSLNEFLSLILIKNQHDRRFRKRELKKLLEKHGFKVNKIKREYFLPTQWDYLGEKTSKITNKLYKPIIFLDKILMLTPLRLFSEGFLCVSKKIK